MQSTAAAASATATATSDDDLKYPSSASALSPPDSSLDDLEAEEYDDDLGVDGAVKKPHFLDYDNKPPAGLEDQVVFVGQPRRSTAVVNGRMDDRRDDPISQSVVEEGSSLELKDMAGRGTWPAASSSSGQGAAKYAGRQNHSMYNDMSEVCPKMECVYSLLSMLGSTNSLEMSTKFMELSKNRETCSALRRSGCIPLLVQIIHNDPNETARKNARQALNNVICCHPDDKAGRREVRVLKLIEQLIEYSDLLRDYTEESPPDIRDVIEDPEKHPIQSITALMKISFDEEHRHAMCQLGALQTISTLIQMDHAVHGAKPSAPKCITMRRYAGMILTNLTFGDGNNKSLLCSNKNFMRALVAQIQSNSDELVQVTASVLRNLSWRADSVIKQTLSEIGTVKILTGAAMVCTIENTLKAILSALWNLSNHCPPNRSEFCEVEGALEFLIDMLTYEAPSKTMSVIENAGGILRNISSHIALREDYRRILRKKNCLKILLEQLKSPSLTVVSNACGTLGNLSGENYEDQKFLRENGAIPMLRSLIYSKHKMISNGSSMALKNLLKPPANSMMANSAGSPASLPIIRPSSGSETQRSELPTLNVRKKKALEQELEEKFLPKGLREEKDICTSRVSPEEDDEEPEETSEEVNHNAVHIRLVTAEDEPEKPVNYSLKEEEAYQDYQETDIDQITDYSLRYAENQSEESDEEKSTNYRRSNPTDGMGEMGEDTVKCYYTEGTPQIISSATSMSDLRVQLVGGGGSGGSGPAATASPKNGAIPKSDPIPIGSGGGEAGGRREVVGSAGASANGGQSGPKALGDTGCNTPDKPYNYCEEGTPDFSRDASLNVMDLSADRDQKHSVKLPPDGESADQPATPATPGGTQHTSKQVSFLNTADETPLMFSRTSSMGSLSSAEPICTADDKSSIISEFSRFASGVISPSELPDSPTQSMPHSPRRAGGLMAKAGPSGKREDAGRPPTMEPTKSAFEDTVNKFNVENTPAVFSCATSLSNLSMDDKEDEESKVVVDGGMGKGPPVLPIPEASASEDGESDRDDDFLLESCINMGMNVMARSAEDKKKKNEEVVVPPPQEQEDLLQRYCTEDTPARLSKVNSNCDLSVLSMDSRNGHESDESSTVSAEQNDRLVEECIRSGMPKPKNQDAGGFLRKENPMTMMRNPAHMGPLYANDEMNNFYVEDSPCAHSTISALSDLTVASEAPNGVRNVYKISSLKGKQPLSQGGAPFAQAPAANGSLSSLSIESDNDDHLLDEAIAAGIGSNRAKQKQPTFQAVQNPLPPVNRMTAAAADANDSLDSIDSVDSNDPQSNSLLEQCIENGMKKLTEKHSEMGFELRAGMNYGQVGPRPPAPAPDESIPDSERDYELLMECIQNGMPKGKNSQLAVDLTRNLQRLTISGSSSGNNNNNNAHVSNPKNVDTTPVVTKDVGATNVMSAGVVAVAETTTTVSGNSNTSGPGITTINNISTSTTPRSSIITHTSSSSIITTTSSITRSAPEPVEHPEAQEERSFRQHPRQPLLASSITASNTSSMMGQSGFESLMERSNEFPASAAALTLGGLMSSSSAGCCTTNSSEMQMSNEFLVEEFTPASNKHKDPDLMLKSVERLTQELVSTAEYLRTVSSSGGDKAENNTWDDDVTSANDVSFPSLSVQAPKILHSCDDEDTATISDEVDSKALDALEEQTPMNENRPLPGFLNGSNEDLSKDELHFQLGGEVQHPMVGGHFTHGTDGLSFSTVSTLTNSTIIAMEATKVANNLQNLAIVESAELDLSKIHPPFGSDSILISDCSDSEMTFRNESRRITLPSGLVAKRALGHAFNDSLNSLNNLDSIGPPSIMDELMDSMISVASITSEVVDVDSGHAGTSDPNISSGHSSLTLNSSLENLIKFSPTKNAGGKSTPISPKRAERRQAMKDRYKTYTIPSAELVDLNQTAEDEAIGSPDVTTPTPSNPSSPSPKKSSKERRQENKSRYETQVITSGSFLADRIASGYQECPRTPIASIIAKPVVFSPLTLHSPAPMSLERVLSPEVPLVDDEDDDPVTYTIQEVQRRKSLEQKLPNISAQDPQTVSALPPIQPKTPLSSPSKVPIKTGSIKPAINPATPAAVEPAKIVRGTKKPPYVSPYRKSVVSAPAVITRTPAAPGAVKKDLTVGSQATPKLRTQSSLVESSKYRPQPLKARSSIGLKRNSLEMNGNGSVRSSTSSSSSDVSRLHTRQPSCGAIGSTRTKVQESPAPAPPNLIRQGTFTKDEPTNPEVPVVTSAPSTPAKTLRKPGTMIPNSASSSRLTTIAKSRIVLHKSISMDASKTTPSTPTAGTPVAPESTPLSSRFRLTSARTSLIDYKKPSSAAATTGRLSTPIGSSSEQPATPTSPGSMIPMRRKSAIAALPKRTNLTMKSNPDVLKGKLDGVRNAFVRTAASAVKTGTR